MEAFTLTKLDASTAAQMLAGEHVRDPRGLSTAGDVARMCERGACFAATHASGAQVVYVIAVENGRAWINAAKGISGPLDLTATVLPVIELQAAKLAAVGFQTARRGLMRKAQKNGYKVAGWIMEKRLTNA